jgi:lipoprotein-releasing system ATP-binding protein
MKKPTILKAKAITKSYPGAEVLKGVSLEVKQGEAIAIMGKSGEGKTTLLHILGTLEKPTSGAVELFGESAQGHLTTLRNQKIGFVFQAFHLLEEMSVIDNVLMPAKIGREPTHAGSVAHTRAMKLLGEVGLAHRAHFLTKLLSGGEKQRVALARALCNDPDLIFADEPSGNLDRSHAEGLNALLLQLVKTKGKGLVVVTHDKELAALCDRTLTLHNGVVV